MDEEQFRARTIGPEAKEKAKTMPFLDRIEDNNIAVLIGPDGSVHNVPAQPGWREGMYLDPAALRPPVKKAAGSNRAVSPERGVFLDNHDQVPAATGFYLQPPGQGMVPAEAGGSMMPSMRPQTMDGAGMPWNWYPTGQVPNPTPPFRGAGDMAGPMPPVGPPTSPGGGGMRRPEPASLVGEPDPILGLTPRPQQAAVEMPSNRGRARKRRARPVP